MQDLALLRTIPRNLVTTMLTRVVQNFNTQPFYPYQPKTELPKNWAKEDGTDLAAVTTFSNLVRSLAPRAPTSLGERREVCGVYKIQTEKNQTTPEQPQQFFHVMQCIT
jgi:hypothetical protein